MPSASLGWVVLGCFGFLEVVWGWRRTGETLQDQSIGFLYFDVCEDFCVIEVVGLYEFSQVYCEIPCKDIVYNWTLPLMVASWDECPPVANKADGQCLLPAGVGDESLGIEVGSDKSIELFRAEACGYLF